VAVAAAAAVLPGLAAAPAQAATGTTVTSLGPLRVDARNGIANQVAVSLTNSTFQVSDRDQVIAGAGCTSITRNLAECAVGDPSVIVNTQDGDDVVNAPVALPVSVNLGSGNDTATTGAGADSLAGNDGDDVLHAGPGGDKLLGHAGRDTLDGGAGNDTLTGLAGADVHVGGDGTDRAVYSGSADVRVTIDGTADDGTFPGGVSEGDDVRTDVEEVQGGSGDDTITGSNLATVTNQLLGGNGDDTLNGLAGRDLLEGGAGRDDLFGGDGLDRLDGGEGADDFSGGPGDGDTADYSDREERVVVAVDNIAEDGENPGGVTEGDNVLTDVEEIFGGSGPDRLTGSAAGNFIDGGDEVDTIFGGGAADTLFGGAGNDNLHGEGGADHLEGGADRDTLIGGADADELRGNAGVDVASYTDKPSNQPVTATLDDLANDGANGGAEGDRIRVDVEDLTGGNGSDTLTGDAFRNVLFGGFGGADTLHGLGGDDTLDGGVANDTLNCGAGVDLGDGGLQFDTATECETTFNVP
jgi:Ca2+-binding RTX toxin-like protein